MSSNTRTFGNQSRILPIAPMATGAVRNNGGCRGPSRIYTVKRTQKLRDQNAAENRVFSSAVYLCSLAEVGVVKHSFYQQQKSRGSPDNETHEAPTGKLPPDGKL